MVVSVVTTSVFALAARGKTTLKAGDMYPDCGLATLVFEEGCQKGYSCGFRV
jgi:hypothetical protein